MNSILGTRIRTLRERAGMKQTDLSKYLNISNTTLSQYETGQRVPSDEIKIKIANRFNVTVGYLLGAEDSVRPFYTLDTSDMFTETKKPPAENGKGLDKNTVIIVGRDGRRIEKKLSDEQIKALEMMIEQLPPFEL